MAEAVQFGKWKAEMHATVISVCKKEIGAISKKSDGRLDWNSGRAILEYVWKRKLRYQQGGVVYTFSCVRRAAQGRDKSELLVCVGSPYGGRGGDRIILFCVYTHIEMARYKKEEGTFECYFEKCQS